MKDTRKEVVRILSIPFSLLFVFFIFYFLWNISGLPKGEALNVLAQHWFSSYGLIFVFISALIEGFLLLGQYYPGGLVIFLGVIAADKNIERVVEVIALVSVAFFISYALNYLVGKYGWYQLFLKFGLRSALDSAQMKLLKHGLNAVIFSYWVPDLATVTATAAGILQLPFKKFLLYSAIGILIWNTFWGTLVATLGSAALQLMNLSWVLGVFSVWVAIVLIKHFWWDKRVGMANSGDIV